MDEKILLSIFFAILMDYVFVEFPNRIHPWVFFAYLAHICEKKTNRFKPLSKIFFGALSACALLSLSFSVAWFLLSSLPLVLQDAIVLYFCLGWKSLLQHIGQVKKTLFLGDLKKTRQSVSEIVSRKTEKMDQKACIRAAIESLVENFSDAVTGSLFWYCIGGWPFALLHRLVNLLDAMWGYKNERFLYFGKFVALFDDVLNYIPARLTALSYVLVGSVFKGLKSMVLYAKHWKSPNAGVLIAAAAGSFHLRLGGSVLYDHGVEDRPYVGFKPDNCIGDVERALLSVYQAFLLWLLVIVLLVWLF